MKAQQDMADWAKAMFFATAVATFLTAVGVFLIWRTLVHTGRAAEYTREMLGAAQAGVEQARRQADAAIQLEAAKIVVSRAYLSPPGGGVIYDDSGVPPNGLCPTVEFKNIGKTRAFIQRSCLVMVLAKEPPTKRFPMFRQQEWVAHAGIPPNGKFQIGSSTQLIEFNDEQIAIITAEKLHIWLYGGIWFKDWFGIPREYTFLWRWKTRLYPGEPNGGPLGFIPHEKTD